MAPDLYSYVKNSRVKNAKARENSCKSLNLSAIKYNDLATVQAHTYERPRREKVCKTSYNAPVAKYKVLSLKTLPFYSILYNDDDYSALTFLILPTLELDKLL